MYMSRATKICLELQKIMSEFEVKSKTKALRHFKVDPALKFDAIIAVRIYLKLIFSSSVKRIKWYTSITLIHPAERYYSTGCPTKHDNSKTT